MVLICCNLATDSTVDVVSQRVYRITFEFCDVVRESEIYISTHVFIRLDYRDVRGLVNALQQRTPQ